MNMIQRQAAAPMDDAPHRPASGAAPFDWDEIFFSRTDERGVLKAFNTVFVRIADFPPEDLLNAPHKIIRHDDMPRGAFWLMWKGIQSGAPVGVYVKNRARDGLYYWVFALVTPIEGGFLSVRIKPSSPLLHTIEAEYAALRRRELDEKLTPEDSAKLLLARIAELGFPSYYSFQAKALATEYAARRIKLGLPLDKQVADVDAVMDAARQIAREKEELTRKFATAELLTANMRINAARLTTGRGTINEIAKGYDLMLQDIRRHMRALSIARTNDGMLGATKDERSLFLMGAERVMSLVRERFLEEGQEFAGVCQKDEAALLDRLCDRYRAEARSALKDAIQGAARMRRDADFLRRLVVGLSTIRITCRVESGMLQGHAQGLETIVRRLDDFHDEIAVNLERIENAADTMTRRVVDHQRG
ncbi:PAS domain-containing protein [Meridianimarinicoccus sp. RP-17]|uniref:histidine kinase n=1 Tax=Meridianimarinicoccus zhengii TaxID=2056810 RepID=UPI000DACE67A|nr:histidine kinase [Phycocomes zhengii]